MSSLLLHGPPSGGGKTSTAHSKTYPPFAILVDIDGTIIGDIDAQLNEYHLVVQPSRRRTASTTTSTTSTASTTNANVFREKMFRDQLVAQLLNGLMRPGFSAFCAQCAVMGIPVFLYTAAETEWAQFLVPAIQQAVRIEMARDLENPPKNFKFARLFTRKHCIMEPGTFNCTKSLTKIGREMATTLKKDYSLPRGVDGLLQRTLLIDNTRGVLNESLHQVTVPTYRFAYLYDVMMHVDQSDARRMARAKALLLSEDSFLDSKTRASSIANSSVPFRTWFYRALTKQMQERSKEYERTRHYDATWKTLRKRLVTYVREGNPLNAKDLVRYLSKV
jgi:hypothetical protein